MNNSYYVSAFVYILRVYIYRCEFFINAGILFGLCNKPVYDIKCVSIYNRNINNWFANAFSAPNILCIS